MGVQTDMATPALARYGSHELKKAYLEPAITGDVVCSRSRVTEPSGGLGRRIDSHQGRT